MKLTLTPRMQRVLALAIAALVAFAAIQIVVWPLWAASSVHAEQVAILKRQASKMKALAEAAPRYTALMKEVGAKPEVQQLTFAAPQATLAVAQLQTKLGEIFVASAVVVTVSQALPEAKEGSLTKVAMQSTIEGDIKSLVVALHAIDAARPLLRVEKLVIRDPDGEFASAAPPNKAPGPNRLQGEIVVSAYMRTP